jgi:coenzyme F420-reducing hydrogenase delta subunit
MKSQPLKISIFHCSNSISAEEVRNIYSGIDDVQINVLSLPCSGKVNLLYFLKTFETGSDGVVLITCKSGECRYLHGNLRAHKRLEAVDDLLNEAGFGEGCIKHINFDGASQIDKIAGEIKAFLNHLKVKPQLIRENV